MNADLLKVLTDALNELLKQGVTPGQHASAVYKTAKFYRKQIKQVIDWSVVQ